MLYLSEPYLQNLQTQVAGQKQDEHGIWFAFEQTIFYPQGGGQSADRGWINGSQVLDVRKEGEKVWHLLAEKIPQSVDMKLDWDYRYENMRQHTGQHVLSASFNRLYQMETVSVHLGSENTLIELNTNTISPEQLQAVEDHANTIVAQNLPVRPLWIYRTDLGQYNLRRDIMVEDDPIRIIQIGDHDCTGCGGLHVRNTAEIGIIKIVSTEKIRKHVRVLCKIGRSSQNYYHKLNDISKRLCNLLSMEIEDLPQRIQILLDEQRELRRQLKTITDKWSIAYARELKSDGIIGFFIIDDANAEQLNKLSASWLDTNNAPCFMVGRNTPQINFALRSPGGQKPAALDFLRNFGSELDLKGGGPSEFVQGMINHAEADETYWTNLQKQLQEYFRK